MTSTDSTFNHVRILVVDDDPVDVRLMQEALRESKVIASMESVYDGIEAMAYLRREGQYSQARRPDLILLDLNMPRKDGREVLAEIKADPELRRIPVVILTTSSADRDVIQTYDLGANAYVVKPVDLDQLVTIVKQIEDFWFSIVRLPPE
jgi:two-component system, chemotaxis family, response regulator Rcp1